MQFLFVRYEKVIRKIHLLKPAKHDQLMQTDNTKPKVESAHKKVLYFLFSIRKWTLGIENLHI